MTVSAAAIRSINALTLATKDMASSCSFYTKLGLFLTHGGYDPPLPNRHLYSVCTMSNV